MLGENIKRLRTEKGLTQKDLADQLFVTPQAVSRWENNEAEPSVSTLSQLAKIFGVGVGELIEDTGADAQHATQTEVQVNEAQTNETQAGGVQTAENVEQVQSTQTQPVQMENLEKTVKKIVQATQKPVLAVCEKCNKPIYDGSEIVRVPNGDGYKQVFCDKCHKKGVAMRHNAKVAYGVSQRRKSYIWGGVITGALVFAVVAFAIWANLDFGFTAAGVGLSLLWFPFISCLFLKNNFIQDMVEEVWSWGFVRFPGLIFELDLDGIIWLLTVKLAFWILGFIIAGIFFVGAVCLGIIVSLFVYPFALVKSYRAPEKAESF